MSAIKKIQLAAKQVEGFKIEIAARNHTMYVDQPEASGGSNSGPTPLEYQFASLASCIITIGHIIARQRHLPLRGIAVEVEGDIDTDVFMGRNGDARAGFGGITCHVHIDGDMTQADKESLLADVDRRCPISDNLQHLTPMTFVVN
jgi:putative redox protein